MTRWAPKYDQHSSECRGWALRISALLRRCATEFAPRLVARSSEENKRKYKRNPNFWHSWIGIRATLAVEKFVSSGLTPGPPSSWGCRLSPTQKKTFLRCPYREYTESPVLWPGPDRLAAPGKRSRAYGTTRHTPIQNCVGQGWALTPVSRHLLSAFTANICVD